MPKNGPFPSTEAALNTYFQTAVAYLLANATRLLVSAAYVTALNEQLAEWNLTYPASQNPNTRTRTAIDKKDAARDALMATMRSVFADIPQSGLTEEDRNTLHLPERSTPTPAPVPATKPLATIDTSKRLEHTIHFRDEDGRLAKPEGARGCQIWVKIGASAKDPSELKYIATDTKTPYVYHFDGADAGKPAYYWLRWENTRGEVGPWSDEVMGTIGG